MIDNFEHILPLLEYPNEDTFYFLQLIKRKKDNPDLGNNSVTVKSYYIYSNDYLPSKKDEIIKLCEIFNARASINLNPRNNKKVAFALLQKIANQMSNGDFNNIKNAYDSVCGVYTSEIDKRWIIDIDTHDSEFQEGVADEIVRLQDEINDTRSQKHKILAGIKTKNGMHIITNPFRLDTFQKKFPDISVHKNNPTLLYCI